MTTIATDGKTIAADGLCVSGEMITDSNAKKLTRLPDGSIVGGCGELAPIRRAIDCLHAPGAHPDDFTGEFMLLRLMPDGEIIRYEGSLFGVETPAPAAIGTGREFAVGAMLAGKAAKRAVEIATSCDVYSGGTIVEMAPYRPQSNAVSIAA